MFLDTPSYQFHEFGDIANEVDVIVNWFKILLEANGCKLSRIEEELETVVDHIKQFMPRKGASKVWPYLFLSTYPNGTVCKQAQQVDGINYPKKRKVKKAESNQSVSSVLDEMVPTSDEELEQIQSVDEINLADISSDEWPDSEEDC